MRALYTSASGMIAQQFNLDVISNNLANVNTAGFKRASAHFQDLLYQNLRLPGAATGNGGQLPTGSQVGLGVGSGVTQAVFSQGNFQKTDNPIDMALRGDGFFKVLLPDGTNAYTRDGGFTVDGQGRLVNSEGYPVVPEIVIPADQVALSVTNDGTVSVKRAGQSTFEPIGNLQLTKFVNPAGLERIGSNLYRQTPASGDPVEDKPGSNGLAEIQSGYVESANVEVIEEMIRMITIQRAYETNSKAIIAADEMLQGANNLKR